MRSKLLHRAEELARVSAESGDRRAFLRHAAGIGLAIPALSLLRDPAQAPASTPGARTTVNTVATPAASPVSAATPVATTTVQMTDQLQFAPPVVTINVGERVSWVNASAMPHTTTGDPTKNPVAQAHPEYAQLPAGAMPWDSGLLQPGESFAHTFTVPGTYAYFCIPHVLSGMRAAITVQG
jgi:plastocyanin